MKYWLYVVAIVLILMATANIWIHFASKTTISEVVIQDKERIVTGAGPTQESKYLIFTDTETFENTDSWLALKFNSSDVYGAIPVGASCSFTVTGFRVPFLSWYRNILDANCSAE